MNQRISKQITIKISRRHFELLDAAAKEYDCFLSCGPMASRILRFKLRKGINSIARTEQKGREPRRVSLRLLPEEWTEFQETSEAFKLDKGTLLTLILDEFLDAFDKTGSLQGVRIH